MSLFSRISPVPASSTRGFSLGSPGHVARAMGTTPTRGSLKSRSAAAFPRKVTGPLSKPLVKSAAWTFTAALASPLENIRLSREIASEVVTAGLRPPKCVTGRDAETDTESERERGPERERDNAP